MEKSFQGFYPETIDFLWSLRMNNHKEWMQENKAWYQQALKEPMEEFADALMQEMNRFGEEFQMVPVFSRMNRDIRFSKDKTPYRAKKWVVFQPTCYQGSWKERPVFFFEIAPEGYFYGMGFFQAPIAYMRNFRKKIEANPEEMLRLAESFEKQNCFVLEGDKYKRKQNQIQDAVLREWYERKTFAITARRPIEELLFSQKLPQHIANEWEKLVPLYRYLQEIPYE